jgi:hypothetical protein
MIESAASWPGISTGSAPSCGASRKASAVLSFSATLARLVSDVSMLMAVQGACN